MSKNKNKNRGGGNAAAKTKNTETAKAVAGLLLVVLLAVAYVITSLALGYASHAGAPVWNPLHWGKVNTADNGNSNTTRTIAVSSDGSAIQNGGAYSMGRNAVSGITYLTETQNNQTYVPDGEIYVTAELSNEYINGAFDWTVDFADPAAEWAVGKVAAYYVSAEPVAGDSSRAKLRYLEPFGEQIILTATLRGTDSSDSCTIDCLKKMTTTGALGYYGDWGDDANFYVEESRVNYSLGTVSGEFEFQNATITFDEDFIDKVNSYLKFNISVTSHSFYASDVFNGSDGDVYCDIQMSMFIEGFNNYDTAHKEAIYYAWYTAARNSQPFARIDISFGYTFNGVGVGTIVESDIPSRDLYCDEGSGVAPNTTLNKNYVF